MPIGYKNKKHLHHHGSPIAIVVPEQPLIPSFKENTMNRLRIFWDDEDREKHHRDQTVKRERQVGAVLMLGLFSIFPIVVLACSDRDVGVSEQTSTRPAAFVQQPRSTPGLAVVDSPEPEPVETISFIPDNPSFEDGEVAFSEQRFDDAFDIFSVWTEINDGTPWGHYMKGLSALKAHHYMEAEDGFGEALAVDPQHLKSLRNISRLYLATDRVEEAFQDIQFAIELDPQSGESYRLLALVEDRLGLTDDALGSYRRALELDPEDVWSMNNIGLIFIQREQFEQALPPLALATRLRQNVQVFYNNLGIALERTGYPGDAAESFRRAVELDPNHRRAEISLARIESRDSVDVLAADLEQYAQSFVDHIDSGIKPSVSSVLEIHQETIADEGPVADDADATLEYESVTEEEFPEISSAKDAELRMLTTKN